MGWTEEEGFPGGVGEVPIEFEEEWIALFAVERSKDDPETNGFCETLFEGIGDELFEEVDGGWGGKFGHGEGRCRIFNSLVEKAFKGWKRTLPGDGIVNLSFHHTRKSP
jgi:hypothetical protein